jgi:hypothetical protein
MSRKAYIEAARDDWNTPSWILREIEAHIQGPIDLDPCSNSGSYVNALTEWHREDLPLGRSWQQFRTIFCNPPWGDALYPWSEKVAQEGVMSGPTIYYLVPARSETQWFRHKVLQADLVVFFPRMSFWRDGVLLAPTPGCVLAWWQGSMPDEKRTSFIERFRQYGWIVDTSKVVQEVR